MPKPPSNKVKLDATIDRDNAQFLEKEMAATGFSKSGLVNSYITEKRKAKSRGRK